MVDRNLIEQIVLEVMKQLQLTSESPIQTNRPKLLVVGETSFVDPNYLLKLKTKWDTISFNDLEKTKLDHVNQVLFLHATQDLLAKGALGIIDTPESKLLARCLFETVPVSVIPTIYLQEQLFHKNPANQQYVLQLLKYKEQLVQFGVHVETLEGFLSKTEEDVILAATPIFKKKTLLTKRDVQDCAEDELVVDKDTIITPLARDTARELGKIIKVMEAKGAKK